MSTRDAVQEIVRDLLADDTVQLDDHTTAAEVPGWDSLAHVSIMFSIEERFGIRFSEQEFTGFATVGELVQMVYAKTQATRS